MIQWCRNKGPITNTRTYTISHVLTSPIDISHVIINNDMTFMAWSGSFMRECKMTRGDVYSASVSCAPKQLRLSMGRTILYNEL